MTLNDPRNFPPEVTNNIGVLHPFLLNRGSVIATLSNQGRTDTFTSNTVIFGHLVTK